MTSLKLDVDGLVRYSRMRTFVPGQANLHPPKKIKQLKALLESKAPNICLVRGEGIGDVLMTTPLIASLKALFQGSCNITYATNTRYLEGALPKVLQHNPDISAVIDRDNIDESDYDIVINLHCPCVDYERKENPPINRIDLFARHAGVNLVDTKVRYFIQNEEKEKGKDFLFNSKIRPTDKVVMVHVFSTATKRNLNSLTFKSALMTLVENGIKLVILKHDSSDYPSDVLFDNIPNSLLLRNASIREIAGVMINCDLVLCPDSSILHLAGALDMPTVSIFGHTDPRARTNYYPKTSVIWEGERLHCAPCWSAPCFMKFACYKNLRSDVIVQSCLERLQGDKFAEQYSNIGILAERI